MRILPILCLVVASAFIPSRGAVKFTRVAAEGGYCNIARLFPDGSGWVAAGIGENFVILDPAAPGEGLVGKKLLEGRVTDIAFRDSMAYVTCQAGGLRVLNIANRKSIREVFAHPFASHASSVSVSGNNVFVTDWNGKKLDILDASAPEAPSLAGTYTLLSNPYHFTAVGNRGYLTFIGFQILDLTDLRNPKALNTAIPGTFVNLAIQDSLAFTSSEEWAAIHNVSNPKDIRQVSVLRANPQPSVGCGSGGIAVAGGMAYLATCDSAFNATVRGTMRAYDVSNPAAPAALCTLSLTAAPEAITLQGTRALVAEGKGGFQVVDLSKRDSLRVVGNHPMPHAMDVAAIGAYAFTVDEHTGVNAYDLSSPESPRRVGGFPLRGARRIEAEGNQIYVLGDSLVLLDAGDPAHLVERARYKRAALNFSASGTRVCALSSWSGSMKVEVLDFSTPGEIFPMHEFGVLGYTENLKLAGDTLFIPENLNDVRGIDLTDPKAPVFLGKIPFQATDIHVEGRLIFLSGMNVGVSIFDRTTLKLVGAYSKEYVGANRILVKQGRLYAGGMYNGGTLAVVDVSNPIVPQELGLRKMPAEPGGMALIDDHLLVADDKAGLQVIRIEDATASTRGGRHPGLGNTMRVPDSKSRDILGRKSRLPSTMRANLNAGSAFLQKQGK